MDFFDVLEQVLALLQRHGRVTYRSLRRQFDLDNEYLEDLKDALLFTYPVADEESRGLVWTGEVGTDEPDTQSKIDEERRFHALISSVMLLLQRDKRVTYRTLKWAFGIDDALAEEIRKELSFRQVAGDERGEGLVWSGETQPISPSVVDVLNSLVTSDTTTSPSPTIPTPSPDTETPTLSNGPTVSPDTIATDAPRDESTTPSALMRMAPEAERRQLTVMFCDLVGSTDLSGRLDPEELREVVRAYQETAAEVIQRYEGHIAQYLGDGLLIYFGYPVAHEDDAQRAVYTGLGIVEAMGTLNLSLEADHGVKLAVRIGIHTGLVVVGEMGSGERLENLALGETPNIAARIESLAEPNTVVISPVTARRVQPAFVLNEIGQYELKGVSVPMVISRVIRPVESETSSPTLRGFDALVGRDEEIGLLLRRWGQSKESLGQVILLSGEAGIGKSALVDGLRHHVRQEGLTRLAFRCSPYHTNSILYPFIDSMQRTLGWQSDDSEETKLIKLERALEVTSLALGEAVPLMASLLSLKPPEDRYPALTLSPHQQRQQTLDTLVAWLQEEAERQPMLAVWEDLHWADPSTLDVLSLILEQTPTLPMLHMLTFRPEFEPPWPTRSHITPITLNRLEQPQVMALITNMARGKALPSEVVKHIVAKTDGVPLYVEELTKMLLESELLREESDRYILTGPMVTVTIPDTLQDSLMARLDQMHSAKEVAQLGAVLGREFSYEMLQTLSSQDDESVHTGLSQLVEAELLYQRGRPPRSRYIFKHALIQDAAYASLLRTTCQKIHQQIAQIIEVQCAETTVAQPELVAHHYTEAGLGEQAVVWWQQAGDLAHQQSAYPETVVYLNNGLSVLETLPETTARVDQEIRLRLAMGRSLYATKGTGAPEVGANYSRLRELCERGQDPALLVTALSGLRTFHTGRAEHRIATELGEESLRIANEVNNPALLASAHFNLGATLFYLGEHRLTLDHFKASRRHQDAATSDLNPLGALDVRYHSQSAVSMWLLGYPDQAQQRCDEALSISQQRGEPYNQGQAQLWALVLYAVSRKWTALHEASSRLEAFASEYSQPQMAASSMIMLGWWRAVQRQDRDGIMQLRQGTEAFQQSQGALYGASWLARLAEAYSQVGQPKEALATIAEAYEVMHATEEYIHHAELHWLHGRLLLACSDNRHLEAEACFQQAINIAQDQAAKSWELRAATSLARLWQSQDKRQDAYDLLAPVYEWFTEGFDTVDLKDAKTLLDELEK